jgi:hypothetical protein
VLRHFEPSISGVKKTAPFSWGGLDVQQYGYLTVSTDPTKIRLSVESHGHDHGHESAGLGWFVVH